MLLAPMAAAESAVADQSYLPRLEALALIQTLNAQILASRSATLSLEQWCRDHRLADEPKIVAQLDSGADKPVSAEQRKRLQIADDEPVKYRKVRLRCGEHTLSEADNWYVPSRLTPEMNRLLETTDTPFGRAVLDLKPYRQTFAAKVLWSPLPQGWETMARADPACGPVGSTTALPIPDSLFEHQAVLYTADHRPFSEVDEVYKRDLLAFFAGR